MSAVRERRQARRVGCKVLETGPLLAGTLSERKIVRKMMFCILNIIKGEIPDTGSNVFSNPKHAGSIQNDKDPSGSTQDPPQDPFIILCQSFAWPLPYLPIFKNLCSTARARRARSASCACASSASFARRASAARRVRREHGARALTADVSRLRHARVARAARERGAARTERIRRARSARVQRAARARASPRAPGE